MGTAEGFAAWLAEQLRRKEWTQSEFARKASLSPSTVNDWYRARRIPDPASCDVIADVLGVDVDGVLAIAGHRPTVAPLDPASPVARLYVYLRRRGLTEEELAAVTGLLETFDKARGRVR